MMFPKLGVNIDHIATLRELRHTPYPNLIEAAQQVVSAGGSQITVHLREDQRHIKPQDVFLLKKTLPIALNLEMAATDFMLGFAKKLKPDWACLVPEKRQELTTEGGLNLKKNKKQLLKVISGLKKSKIKVSLFVEPNLEMVRLSHALGANAIEIHTGRFAIATQQKQPTIQKELCKIEKAATKALELGLKVHAGHGLDYENIRLLVGFKSVFRSIEEYNIGHSIVCRAVMVGLESAVRAMVSLIQSP